MSAHELLGFASIVVLGIAAQWLAWRLHLPSILLLLLFGFAAGPLTGFLDPEALIGKVLFPLVSFSVAIILFEGGLSLRLSELKEIHRSVRNLVTVGALVTWILAALSAYLLLSFSLGLSLLLGAILIVTGPTVIIPLLRHVRPVARVGSIIKWEGILNDPVGATVAVLVFEVLHLGLVDQATEHVAIGFLLTILTGILMGLAGTLIVILFLKQYWVPDFLQSPFTFMGVIGTFTASNLIRHESGLLAVTLLGVVLANQRWFSVRHIIEFKENLRVLLISFLFILLAARLSLDDLQVLDWRSALFVASMILVVRPVAVWISTLGSQLSNAEKLFLCWMAPRGIVAASVASLFALELSEAGSPAAASMVPVTFLLIVATVALYGLTAKPVARWLGLAQAQPQGFLILGGQKWALELAHILAELGSPVLVADSNRQNVSAARLQGLKAYYGDVLAEHALDEIPLSGLGRLLALTSNDEANSLACLHFTEVFGRAEVYQLAPSSRDQAAPSHLRGRQLFHPGATAAWMQSAFLEGARIRVTKLTPEFGYEDFLQQHQRKVLPLLLIQAPTVGRSGTPSRIRIFTLDRALAPAPGDQVITLVGDVPAHPRQAG